MSTKLLKREMFSFLSKIGTYIWSKIKNRKKKKVLGIAFARNEHFMWDRP